MARRVVDVLVPVALDRAYSYRVPEELTPRAGRRRVGAAWARARPPRWCGRRTRSPIRGSTTGSRTSRKNSMCRRCGPSCAASSIGWPITPCRRAAWCCACACAWASISAPERERIGVQACRRRRRTRMTAARAPRARAPRRRHGARQRRGRARSRRQHGRDRRADRRRHAGDGRAAAGAGRRKARSGFHAAGISHRAERRRRRR